MRIVVPDPLRTELDALYGRDELLPGAYSAYPVVSASTSTASPNTAFLARRVFSRDIPVASISFEVTSQAGNMDLGIYNESFTRLYSTGSFAVPASGSAVVTLSSVWSLKKGLIYFVALAVDDNAKFRSTNANSLICTTFADHGTKYALQAKATSSFPLPTQLSTLLQEGKIPFMALRT